MSEELDPYAPPAASGWIKPVVVDAGHGWKVEGQSLWVRDAAVLPDVCIVSGKAGIGGRRVSLHLPGRRRGPRINISVFRSYRGVGKDIVNFVVGPIVGTLAAVACSEWMIGDESATVASISASLGLFILGVAFSASKARRALRIVASRDGWHELQGVNPAALKHLGAIGAVPSQSRPGVEACSCS
ncbi:hypothetical protein [Haloferula sp. BvORR071]|uniref:hypothetical protein n=1 Tax=Haloferula sp. BvORR071 TaxID=1396141 RepID=UPI00055998EB|nr:hypothetical protein [Haloferula sp. BvORR071]